MIKFIIRSLVVFSFLVDSAFAHSYIRYISTPIIPPREFLWWWPISIGILFVGSFLILWWVIKKASIGLAVRATAIFCAVFYLIGRFIAPLSPGLGFPHRTFWGFGWLDVGEDFIRWNLFGLALFVISLLIFGCIGWKRWESETRANHKSFFRMKRKMAGLILFASFVYTLGLLPFLVTGAFVHGWCGGYIYSDCGYKITVFNESLCEYALDHDGRLPAANDISDLLVKLEPYLDKHRKRLRRLPIEVCPVGAAYERSPRPYIWNTNFSGKPLDEIDPSDLYEEVPLYCPYHQTSLVSVSLVFQFYPRQLKKARAAEDDSGGMEDGNEVE